ncbi:MAG: TrpB-like pyridoxal phosphate-dependent enzyme [Candidatus Binatia bacterium]|nr:TrpB-like pyridoxal phosphate-dependent enzyme [Candidatus Binatia bacterium]
MNNATKILLPEERLPTSWYNIVADLPLEPPPALHPGTGKPIIAEELAPLFPPALIEQEFSRQREVPIPEEVRSLYRLWRPTPLFRAWRWEKILRTPARIYYKYEGVSPAGSHKPNTAVAQAFYNRQAGIRRLATETGAGQWGSSLALACNFFGLECQVFMVRVSYNQKPYRRALMETYGAHVVASPSSLTKAGREVLARDPECSGSLGIAISEAVEVAAADPQTNYALGSVLNHVLLHQTVIGLEALEQFAAIGEEPDIVVACTGGGSNFAGIAFPFLGRMLRGGPQVEIRAVEPAACPSLTKGKYTYDFGDTAHLTPLMKMHTLGSSFVPPGIHAGGLRYHGMAPLVSHVVVQGLVKAEAVQQLEAFAAGVEFARAEGIVPAPEANHAIAGARRAALQCREEGRGKVILFNLCGHGHFDMQAYMDYAAGRLQNFDYPDEEVAMALAGLPAVGVD